MTKLRTLSLAAALSTSLAAGARSADAGPSVIRDESLTDLGTTPVLGRGYSIATNTFQSICMKEIVKTKPSYDFKYKFEQIDDAAAEEIKRTGDFQASYGGSYGFFSVRGSMKGSYKSHTTSKRQTVNIMVTIDVDTYYASMDETKGELADTAVSLVKGDLPAFFDACGMYYVRSINRNSKIFALFQFDSKSEAEDSEFAAELEAEIRGWGWSGSMRSSMSGSSKSSHENKSLRITTNAEGLGKIAGTSLLAYDLDTFRKAVQTAFLATQDEDVGRVTSIEVVPWVEHLQFQALMLGNANYSADGKRNMLVNSEFLAEVDRASRAKLNGFYRAKQCRMGIQGDYQTFDDAGALTWMTSDGGTSYGMSKVVNHRTGLAGLTLDQLFGSLSPEKQQFMYNEYDAFMYGGKDDLPVIVQNGRRTYRYDLDNSPLISPTGANRSDWAAAARTALDKVSITPPDGWLLAYGKAYLRGNGQAVSGDPQTFAALLAALPVDGDKLKTPFTEKLVFLDGTERKTLETSVTTRTEVENGIWRLAFNNPGAIIESKDGWFGFAAANILEDETFADKWAAKIRDEVKARTDIELDGGKATVKELGDAYSAEVTKILKERPGVYPSFAALEQGAVARVLESTADQRGDLNTDPFVIAYLLKQMKAYAPDYLVREAIRYKFADAGAKTLDDGQEWKTAKRIYEQYKTLAGQGGSMSLGAAGFFGSAEYVGAARCVRDLLRDNRFLKDSYRNVESCRRVESQLGTIRSSVVEDYCMPTFEQPKP